MNTEKTNKFIAEHIMGWQSHNTAEDWSPINDPTDDYDVLKHIRDNWSKEDIKRFTYHVTGLWEDRDRHYWGWITYEPGDYSKAALIIIGQGSLVYELEAM